VGIGFTEALCNRSQEAGQQLEESRNN